ncbi:hypothetical protein PUN28_019734 [Cardiocondyla obscurior]|uniref:Uncharacterized protein n=1 Tax=Cardiocondyla obscurior TaxID=286306 RepID=A0AAW2EEA6_9HYME
MFWNQNLRDHNRIILVNFAYINAISEDFLHEVLTVYFKELLNISTTELGTVLRSTSTTREKVKTEQLSQFKKRNSTKKKKIYLQKKIYTDITR